MSGTPLDLSVFQQRWQSLAANRTVESTVRSEKPVDVSYWSTLVSKALGLYIVPVKQISVLLIHCQYMSVVLVVRVFQGDGIAMMRECVVANVPFSVP